MQSRRNFIKKTSILALALPAVNLNEFSVSDEDFWYQSRFIKAALNKHYPVFTYFSTDSLGKSQFHTSPLFPVDVTKGNKYISKETKNSIAYYTGSEDPSPVWEFTFSEKQIVIRARFHENISAENLFISFSQRANHCTVLGHFSNDGHIQFPNVLHFPNMGSFRMYCSQPGVNLYYNAELTDKPFVNIAFPSPTSETKDIIYTLTSAAIYADDHSIGKNALYDGYKKGFINMFQLSPGLKMLANNSTSDPCAFTVFLYAEMARKTPELVEGLNAFDLVRVTLDKYLDGFKGYGMVGKPNWHSAYNSSDSFPSLVIAACYYILHTDDTQWKEKNYDAICQWADQMIATDKNHDGIIEYGYSGNANSWSGDMRPANWWDTIGFGHDDAYSNALAYKACMLLSEVGGEIRESRNSPTFQIVCRKFKTELLSEIL